MSVKYALKLLRLNRRKVKWHNIWVNFRKKGELIEKPLLYSSIPLKISKNEWATELTHEHLTLQKRLKEKSVVLIDEVGGYCSQYQYNISSSFTEFIRLFRHYTKGGYLVINDQASSNIVKDVRTRINSILNLSHFKIYFKLFYMVKIRNISITEDIITIEENNKEDNMKRLLGLAFFSKKYDTYCYSERYKGVPVLKDNIIEEYKKYKLLQIKKDNLKALTLNEKPINIVTSHTSNNKNVTN